MEKNDGEGRGERYCRACLSKNLVSAVNLGNHPIANRLRTGPTRDEKFYPLEMHICHRCSLGQIGEFVQPELIFGDYVYRSSTSRDWLAHTERLAMNLRNYISLESDDWILEIASNDGHFLKQLRTLGIKAVGVEPSTNLYSECIADGLDIKNAFFGMDTARQILKERGLPSAIIGNNVLAHVPDIRDFMLGLRALCSDETKIFIENHWLLSLIQNLQFDSVYHEHYSYLSATSVQYLASQVDLALVDVTKLDTHGGSLRYELGLSQTNVNQQRVMETIAIERDGGISDAARLERFGNDVQISLESARAWLKDKSGRGSRIVGYGAAAKTTTLMNLLWPASQVISTIHDKSTLKQGLYLPGTFTPIVGLDDDRLRDATDVVLFSWNWYREILSDLRAKGVTAEVWTLLPEPRCLGS